MHLYVYLGLYDFQSVFYATTYHLYSMHISGFVHILAMTFNFILILCYFKLFSFQNIYL